jgi:hypothetical protein
MKQTQKYTKATARLTFPHSNQDELYSELNRIGYYWNSKTKEWERDDRLPNPANKLIKLRVWTAADQVESFADLIVESCESIGLELVDKSKPYPCRPPQQLESRIYLLFSNKE